MNYLKIKSSLLSSILTLFLCFPWIQGDSLKEIAQPYLGVYECTQAQLNDTDFLNRFSYIDLELKTENQFVLYYCEKNGERKQEEGKYRYDAEKQTLTLIGGTGGFFKREFPFKEGILTINVRFGEQTLFLKFEQK